ncbi:MAG: hypothetical protein OHK0046_03480 [Anaerolineae bacterium]
MPNQQPPITAVSGRQFAGSAAATLGLVMDADERLLMLSHPKRPNRWEVINGALDANETLLQGALREVQEEAGPIQVRPLGVIHAYTFRYDDNVQYMLSIAFLFEYLGGEVIPGDDMTGSAIRWFSLPELESGTLNFIAPNGLPWIFRRTVELFRMLKGQPDVELQPDFNAARNKYEDI